MRMKTLRFGTVPFESRDAIEFEKGLMGDPHDRQWLLLADQCHPSLYWLQSVQHPDRSLPVCAISDEIVLNGLRLRNTHDLPDWVSHSSLVTLAPLTSGMTGVAIGFTQPYVIDPSTRRGAQADASFDQTLQRVWSDKVSTLRECA